MSATNSSPSPGGQAREIIGGIADRASGEIDDAGYAPVFDKDVPRTEISVDDGLCRVPVVARQETVEALGDAAADITRHQREHLRLDLAEHVAPLGKRIGGSLIR